MKFKSLNARSVRLRIQTSFLQFPSPSPSPSLLAFNQFMLEQSKNSSSKMMKLGGNRFDSKTSLELDKPEKEPTEMRSRKLGSNELGKQIWPAQLG